MKSEEFEKAKELIRRLLKENDVNNPKSLRYRVELSKIYSIICVNEIIKYCESNHVESWNSDWLRTVEDEIKNFQSEIIF